MEALIMAVGAKTCCIFASRLDICRIFYSTCHELFCVGYGLGSSNCVSGRVLWHSSFAFSRREIRQPD